MTLSPHSPSLSYGLHRLESTAYWSWFSDLTTGHGSWVVVMGYGPSSLTPFFPFQVPSESADSGVSFGGDAVHSHNIVDDLPGPPDGGWGWVIRFACFSCNFVLDGIAYSFGVMLETLVNHFESNRGSVSWVGSLLVMKLMYFSLILFLFIPFTNITIKTSLYE